MEKRHIAGKPCRRGHTVRYVTSGNCVECKHAHDAERRARRDTSTMTFEGGPCSKGHTTRYRTRGHCVQCARDASKKLQATRAKWYAANRERKAAAVAVWRQANPDSGLASARARRARRLGATGRMTRGEQRELLQGSLGLCSYCNERGPLALDHIEPLSKGGSNDAGNAAAVCRSCNSSKSNKPLLLWLAHRRQRAA